LELNKKEKILLYAFLKKHEKELKKELYTLKYRLEKEVLSSLTIEEIEVLDKTI